GLHVLAGLARRQQLLILAFALRDATAGVLPVGVILANGLLPAFAILVGVGPVFLADLVAGFRYVAVGAGELDGIGILAAVAEPIALLPGDDVADRERRAALGQDDALGQVVLVVELELARVLFLVAEQLEFRMVVAEGTDLRRIIRRAVHRGRQVLVADD